ncbi:hypothetical protein F4860DRAFT_496693 [Xylaria cubensis]|nr:hypothetical protein F4860DRAFT_496693 [Xylaria cubensis]
MAAMNVPPQLNRQPNFNNMVDHLQEVTMELGLCNNLGPVRFTNELANLQLSMNRMMDSIEDLTRTVNGLDAKITSVTTELDAKIDTVKTQLDAKITSVTTELDAKITSAKDELNAKIDTVKDELNAKIDTVKDELNAKITSTQSMIDDCDFNNQARVANSTALRLAHYIYPLRNTTTHEVIELPKTKQLLEELEVDEINTILLGLGQQLVEEVHEDDRLNQLKRFIGVQY